MTDMLDVLVVGGGPVGACMGALLARGVGQGAATPFRVAILEPHRPEAPSPEAPIDSRVVAISRSSERILQGAGAWDGARWREPCAPARVLWVRAEVTSACAYGMRV